MRLFGKRRKKEEKETVEKIKAAVNDTHKPEKVKPIEPKKEYIPEKKKGKKKGRGFHLFRHKEKKHKEHKKRKKHEEKKKPKRPAFVPRNNLVPKFYESWVKRQLWFSGSERGPRKTILTMIIMSLIISVASGAVFRTYAVYLVPGVFLIIFGVLNAMLILSVDRRGRFVDEILPDALLLLSANIRAGYIPSRALILSARKEFGPLSVAIRKAGKEIMTGASIEEGMKEIPERIRSQDLIRTIKLIIEGIKGGGQIVTLLEENAIDIRRRQAIRKEIKANIMMYAIFIAFAGCLGAPGLYALSGYLTSTTSSLSPDIAGSAQISDKVAFIQMGGVQISEEFLFQFSIAAILITTIFGGLILGLINSGREKDGLKYAPILSVIAILVFFAANFAINLMFSAMLPG
ncbi:MAG: type II secretion system F family protein [Candidatus Aenigmatarchaeota archaeon]|nr:MAG: type II secretion system F family protein [Candidatus Aenigmarchaeota archaeon]